MLCEFIGGPENGQREEIGDDCREVYCAGLDRNSVDWYERDGESAARFIHRGQLTREAYLERTKEERKANEIPDGFRNKAVPKWARSLDEPDWAK